MTEIDVSLEGTSYCSDSWNRSSF